MKKSKYHQYFYCFIIYSFIFLLFYFYYSILKSAAFRGVALIRGEALIRGRRLFQCGYPRMWRLFETRCILEEIRY